LHNKIQGEEQPQSLTEKIRPVIPVLLGHAGIMLVAEKNLIITGFSQLTGKFFPVFPVQYSQVFPS